LEERFLAFVASPNKILGKFKRPWGRGCFFTYFRAMTITNEDKNDAIDSVFLLFDRKYNRYNWHPPLL